MKNGTVVTDSVNMIPRTSIEEANKHLNLLHGRVSELEKTVSDQHDALREKDEQLKSKIAEISATKNVEIESLRRKLRESEQTVILLQNQIQQKDEMIAKLQHGIGPIGTLLAHKTNVENVLHAMKIAEKSLKEVGFSVEPTTQPPTAQRKEFQLNGFGGSTSSQEEHNDRKMESSVKSADTKTHKSKSKRHGGKDKEFYL